MSRIARAGCLAVVFLAACSSPKPATITDKGKIATDVSSLDFPPMFVGDKVTLDVRVQNQGRSPGAVHATAAGDPGFQVVAGAGTQLSAAQIGIVSVQFSPATVGDVTGTLTVSVEGIPEPVKVTLTGHGSNRTFTTDSMLDFGEVPVGDTRKAQLKVTSTALLPIVVQTNLSGTDASAFTLGQMAVALPPGKDALLDITFRPVLADARAATLTLSSCDTCDKVTVQLQGTGTSSAFSVSPDTIDFGRLDVGATAHHDIVVKSLGTIPVWFAGVNLVVGPGSPFSITPPTLPVLITDQNVTLGVDYAPTSQGTYDADLLFEVGGTTKGVHLSGSSGPGALVVDPEPIEFGLRPSGALTKMSIKLSDSGTGLQILDMRVDGDPAAVFHLTKPTLPAGAPKNNPLLVPLGLQAATAGEYTADLVIFASSNLERHVPIHALVADGGVCNLDVPATLRMGLTGVGRTLTQNLTLHNKGTTSCGVATFALAGSPAFRIHGAAPGITTIPAGGDLDVGVDYTPPALSEELDRATLTFQQTNPDTPTVSVSVTGAGSVADVRAAPLPVSFGKVPIGGTQLLSVDLTNASGPPVRISSQVVADSMGPFSVAQAAPTTLPAGGGAQTLTLAFKPTSAATFRTSLLVSLENTLEPVIIPVQGEGTSDACGALCDQPQASCPLGRTTWPFRPVALSGYGIDGGGQAVTCAWSVTGAPVGSTAVPDAPGSCRTGFTADMTGDFDLTLDVADPDSNHATCTTRVHAAPFAGLLVTSTWDIPDVVDLHLFHPDAGDLLSAATWRGSTFDCWKGNPRPPWDAAGTDDDPALDAGVVQGPEMAWISSPKVGATYRIGVHRSSSLFDLVNVTTSVYCGGVLAGQVTDIFNKPYTASPTANVTFSAPGVCTFVAKNPSLVTVVP